MMLLAITRREKWWRVGERVAKTHNDNIMSIITFSLFIFNQSFLIRSHCRFTSLMNSWNKSSESLESNFVYCIEPNNSGVCYPFTPKAAPSVSAGDFRNYSHSPSTVQYAVLADFFTHSSLIWGMEECLLYEWVLWRQRQRDSSRIPPYCSTSISTTSAAE